MWWLVWKGNFTKGTNLYLIVFLSPMWLYNMSVTFTSHYAGSKLFSHYTVINVQLETKCEICLVIYWGKNCCFNLCTVSVGVQKCKTLITLPRPWGGLYLHEESFKDEVIYSQANSRFVSTFSESIVFQAHTPSYILPQ